MPATMSKKRRARQPAGQYRVRYTETVCWEVIVEADDETHAKEIVEAAGDDALAHRFPRWKHGDHQIESVELMDED
jgi:hypothetical protein